MGRASNRKGASYENEVAKHFRARGFHVTRAKQGNDEGDLLGISKTVVECKNQRRFDLAGWVDQMLAEVQAAGKDSGVVIAKRPGKGNVAEHYAVMTVEMYLDLIEEAAWK